MNPAFGFSRSFGLAAVLASVLWAFPRGADAQCDSDCGSGDTFKVTYSAQSEVKNGSVSISMEGGPTATKTSTLTDTAETLVTPEATATIHRDTVVSGTAQAASDHFNASCAGYLSLTFGTSDTCGLKLEVRSKLSSDTDYGEWKEGTAIYHPVNFASKETKSIDYQIRLVSEDGEDEEEDPEGDDDSEGGETGGGSPDIPEDDQDVPPATSGGPPANVTPASFYSRYDLGPGVSGRRVGSTRISGSLTSGLANVANLRVMDAGIEEDLDVVTSGGSVRQIFTSLRLVDVQPNGSGFELRFYLEGTFNPVKSGGLYPINGGATPFKVIRYLPVVSVVGQHYGGVRVVEVGMRGTTRTRDVVSTGTDGRSYRIIDENGLRVIDAVSTFLYSGGAWERTDQVTENRDGQLYSKTENTYRYLVRREGGNVVYSGKFLVSNSVYTDATNSLTTTYVPDPLHLGKLKSVTRPDESWTAYTYYSGSETNANPRWRGLIKEIFRPWNGSPATVPATPSAATCERTAIVYSDSIGDFGYEEESRETTLPSGGGSVVVAKSETVTPFLVSSLISFLSNAGIHSAWLPDAAEIEATAMRTYASAGDWVAGDRFTYRYPSDSPRWDGTTCATLDETASGTATGYQMGTYDAGTGVFTVDTTGSATTNTHVQRISVEIKGGFLTPEESTREVAVSDLKGRLYRRELWIYDANSTWSLASASTYEYPTLWPDGSIREVVWKKDGRIVRRVYQTSGTELHEWDEQGIETVSVADLIGRAISLTHVGTTGQADRVTSTAYSGRSSTTTVSSAGSSLSSSRTDDLSGRPLVSTDRSGAETAYTYPNGGRDTSVTLPGGLTRIETRNIDGRLVSVAGTSVVDTVYEYAVLSGGNIATTVRTGDLANSPRYRTTEKDWAGRTVKVTSPSPTGSGTEETTYAYTPGTRLVASVISAAGTVLSKRENLAFSLTLSGMDADTDDDLTPDSNDRVTETRGYYALEGGYWWAVSYRKQYDQDGSDASAVTTVTKTCLHGQPDGVAEKSVRIAATGETITTAVAYDRATKTRVTTESTSGVTATAVETDVNGLILSRKGYDTTAATAFYYDSLGRPYREVSPRGEITERSYYADGSLKSVKDHAGKSTVYSYYGPTHASAGKLATATNPDGKTITYAYDDLGNVTEEAGTATYKVTYQYDEYGARWKMFTWRDATTSDATEWIYQAGTGLLQAKKDAANQSVTYTYHASGKVATRTWARGVTSTYSYNGFGDLTGIDYSDATPDVTLASHDRLGRPRAVTQSGLGSEVLAYLPGKLGLQSRYYAGATGSGLTIHKLLPGRGIRYSALDSAGRSSGFLETASTTSSTSYSTSRTLGYAYDAAGRLQTITDTDPETSVTQSVAYAYHADSSLISTVQNKTSGTAWFEERRYYDTPGRLTGIRSKRLGSSTAELTTYAYDYDSLGRRTKSTFQDGSHWEYGYNDRSEVTSATRRNASGTEVSPLSASYSYDGIGNRLSSTSGVLGNHGYTPNSLNQYATVTTGNSRSAVGRADSAWTVEVNNAAASRTGDIYHHALTTSNGSAPVWQGVVTERSTGTPASTGHFWYAKASTAPAYDADGNLLSDGRNGSTDEGRWVYTWDAENRLIKMESSAAAVTAGMSYTKLVFEYDWQGKRIARHVWRGGSSGSPVFLNSRRWLYEGWNPVAEFTGTSDTAATGPTAPALNRYTWGLDLGDAGEGIARPGQMLQRAGGVGGLVLQTTVSGGVMERPSYDGNGNIVAWTKSSASVPTSRREYDAFGNVVMSEGASPSAFGFSTKIEDSPTGLLYYGYRYYQPEHGRWINRDPAEENGGINLCVYLDNRSTDRIEFLGLAPCTDCKGRLNVQLDCEWTDKITADSTENMTYEILAAHKLGRADHARVIWTGPCAYDELRWIEDAQLISAPSSAKNLGIVGENGEMSVETRFFLEGFAATFVTPQAMELKWEELRNKARKGSVAKFCCCKYQNH